MTLETKLHNGERDLFEDRGRFASNAAWACTVYAMVPYLGLLFVPPALVMSGYFVFDAQRKRQRIEMRDALGCMAAGFTLLAAQLVLWWLLYLIPKIGL